MSDYIPLSVPSLKGNELDYVKECVDTEWVSSAGSYVEEFEKKIASYTNSKFAIACVNGTSALQVSLRLVGVSAGDEVIVPTLTFIAPINAIHYNNASPIFMDSDHYYNIDPEKTIDFIKKETFFKNGFSYNKKSKAKIAAILPVHVWGNAVWLDELIPFCQERNIAVVEDASESLGTLYEDGKNISKHSGTIGKVGCISFNGNKIITTGGGGMILTDEFDIAEKAKYLTTQAKDDPIRYRHNEIGYNFRLTNIQSAIGVAQLEQLPAILDKKKLIHDRYSNSFEKINGLNLAQTPDYARNNHWLNLLQINTKRFTMTPEQLMIKLEKEGIQTRPVWILNSLQEPYIHCQNFKIDLAMDLVCNSLCLPSSASLKKEDIDRIVDTIMNLS